VKYGILAAMEEYVDLSLSPNRAPKSRVLLLYHNPLFAHSLRVALRAQPQIALVAELDDWTHADAAIGRLAPAVVVVEEDERDATDAMLRLLRGQHSPWRVIALRLDETAMHIWSGVWQPIIRAEDLIDALCV
jgi:hypothetical protein